MGIYLFFIPYELLIALIIIPVIVFSLIKKDQGFWSPLGIITLSAVSCLFFNHSLDIKIMIWGTGLVGIYFNRKYLPIRVKTLLEQNKE